MKSKKSKKEAWDAIEERIGGKQRNFYTTVWRYAAAILIGALGLGFYFSGEVNHQTSANESESIQLPDQSIIDLKPGTQISYNKWIYQFSRKIEMEGQAVFSVVKGKGFKVNTEEGSVSVLGTIFEINTNSGFVVNCYSGRVLVEEKQEAKVLTANQYYQENKVHSNGERDLNFQRASTALIVRFIEEFYQVDISYSSELNQKYTGSIPLTDVNRAMKSLCLPMGLDYTMQESGQYFIQ